MIIIKKYLQNIKSSVSIEIREQKPIIKGGSIMEINEIRCSFEEQREIKFSKKFKILLGIAIFLTGTIGILGTFLILPMSISERVWVEFGVNRL